MTTPQDRSAPGVRLTLLRDENLSVLGAQAGRPRTP